MSPTLDDSSLESALAYCLLDLDREGVFRGRSLSRADYLGEARHIIRRLRRIGYAMEKQPAK